MLDTELGICNDTTEQLSACRSLLAACSTHTTNEPIWFIAGRTRLRLAHILHVCGQPEEARRELEIAKATMTKAIASGRSNKTELFARLQELKDSTPATEAGLFVDDASLLKRYEAFSNDQTVQRDAFIYSTALDRGEDVALAILEKDASASNREMFWRWSSRTEALLEEIGDIAHLYMNRLATGDIACNLFSDRATLIEWHKRFDEKHRSFNLWLPKMNCRKTLALIQTQIRNEDQALKAVIEIKEIAADQDSFWYEEGFRSQAEISSQRAISKANEKLLPIAFETGFRRSEWLLHDLDSLPAHFLGSWEMYRIKVGTSRVDPATDVEQLLLKLMKKDFAHGLLSTKDIESICSTLFREDLVQSLDKPLNHSIVLDTLSPEALSAVLYGTAGSPTSEKEWEEIFETLSAWLLNRSTEPENQRHYLLFQIQNTRQSKSLHASSSFEMRAAESQRLIDLVPQLNATVREQVSSNISAWRSLIASAKSAVYLQTHNHPFFDTEIPEFQEVLGLYNQSLAENFGNGRILREVHAHVNIAQLYFHAAFKLNQQAIDPFFQALLNAVAALERVREGWRALRGWERVQNLTLALEDPMIMNIIPWAVAILCQFPDSHADFRASNIWSMIQAAKSIGLGWLTEINMEIVRGSLADTDTDAGSAPNDKVDGKQENRTCPSPPDEHVETAVDNSQGKEPQKQSTAKAEPNPMAGEEVKFDDNANPSTSSPSADVAVGEAQKQANSEGPPYTMLVDVETKLQRMGEVGGDVVFVDWYNGSSRLKPFIKPLLTVISPGQRPKCCLADITWETVDNFAQQFVHLDTDDLKSKKNSKILYKLNPLVEPLKQLSRPGQTLVFSPCGNLHRIPLHALKIDGEVLIERNPIVYCSSISLLIVAFESRQDFERKMPAESPSHQPSSFNASIYGDPPSEVGKKALQATAFRLRAQNLHTGDEFKAEHFNRTIQDSDINLVHYHGHAHFSHSSPMDQSLAFKDQHFTLRQIFDVPPGRRAFHVSLLGCGSGASKTMQTNDVIGLGPSLFHAGAASTVSSLWTFSDADAALFSEYFYEEFKSFEDGDTEALEIGVEGVNINGESTGEQRVGSEGFLWNLAIANQRAVLKIKEQKGALYHWAGFVLNGWWMMHVPGCTVKVHP